MLKCSLETNDYTIKMGGEHLCFHLWHVKHRPLELVAIGNKR